MATKHFCDYCGDLLKTETVYRLDFYSSHTLKFPDGYTNALKYHGHICADCMDQLVEEVDHAMKAKDRIRAKSDPAPATEEQKTQIPQGKLVGGDGLEPPTLSV